MRRALALAIAALGAAAPLRAQQVTARVGGNLTGLISTTITVPVAVDMTASGGAALGSYTARLSWDPTALCLVGQYNYCGSYGGQDTTMQGNFPLPYANYDSAYSYGVLRFSALSPSGVAGLVTLAQLRFQVTTSDTTLVAPVALSFSEMSAAGSFQDLLPLLTVQGANFCVARGRWGDLDKDGYANSRDALFVLTHVVGLPTPAADTALADVSGDNAISSLDALVILSYAVGMPVSGQRVMLAAPRSCGTGSPQQVAILPGTIDLVPGQPFQLSVQATDSAGHAVTVTGMTWQSSDYNVAAVDVNGLVSARAVGSVTVTAILGPGLRATATVNVIPRRPNWYVDLAATGHPVQNGSQAYPYQHPVSVFPYVSEGDTVRVATGRYEWVYSGGSLLGTPGARGPVGAASAMSSLSPGEVRAGIVLIGGTPGDTTTRPVFHGGGQYSSTGLWLHGGVRTEIRNVVFDDLDPGIDIDGLQNLVVEDTKFTHAGSTNYGDGIYNCTNAPMDTVRIDRTTFEGDPQYRYGSGVYFSGCSSTISAAVMTVRDSRFVNVDDALMAYGVDSLAVIRTDFIHNGGYGVYLARENNETPALWVTQSRFDHNRSTQVYADYLRSAVIDTSAFGADSSNGIYLHGPYNGPTASRMVLRGDSLDMAVTYYYGNQWMDMDRADTALIQDLVVRGSVNAYVYGRIVADSATVRRARFTDIGYVSYAPIDFGGRQLVVDSVSMTACPAAACNQAYGVSINPASGYISSSSILRSTFSGVRNPIRLNGAGSVHEVRGNVIDSAETGIYANGVDSVAATDNAMTRIYLRGMDFNSVGGARGPSPVARNTITCTTPQYSQAGVRVYSSRAAVDQDTITACTRGVDLGYVLPGTGVRRSTLRSNAIGVYQYQSDTLMVPIDSNGISGSITAGVYVDYGRALVTYNRIENDSNGVLIYDYSTSVSQLHNNAFVNNMLYAVAAFYDSADASGNFWNPDAAGGQGGPPSLGTPNGVNTTRVNTSGPLPVPPSNLPGLAPPAPLRLSFAAVSAAGGALRSVGPATAPATAPPAPRVYRTPAYATVPSWIAPTQAARIEARRQRTTEQHAARQRQEVEAAQARAARQDTTSQR